MLAQSKKIAAKSHWYRFTLKRLFVFIAVLCVGLVWFRVARQESAVTMILENGWVEYENGYSVSGYEGLNDIESTGESPAPQWLMNSLGIDFFSHVETVGVSQNYPGQRMSWLGGLKRLKKLNATVESFDALPLEHLQHLVELEVEMYGFGARQGLQPLIQLKNLRSLRLYGFQKVDLSELTKLENLKSLSLFRIKEFDLAPLPKLKKLEHLRIQRRFVEFELLSELTHLRSLHVRLDSSDDFVHLVGLKNLESLAVQVDNGETDLTLLAKLENLRELTLIAAGIRDLTPLTRLKHLECLVFERDSGLVNFDLAPLAALPNLKSLRLKEFNFGHLRPLIGLNNLETLYLGKAYVDNVRDLKPLTDLKNLEELELFCYRPWWRNSEREPTDLSPLKNFPKLKNLRITTAIFGEDEIERLKQALPKCRFKIRKLYD